VTCGGGPDGHDRPALPWVSLPVAVADVASLSLADVAAQALADMAAVLWPAWPA
jgi:hypothetical protein